MHDENSHVKYVYFSCAIGALRMCIGFFFYKSHVYTIRGCREDSLVISTKNREPTVFLSFCNILAFSDATT